MRAVLRSLDSIDAPDGLELYSPPDPRSFGIVVTATIGEPDSEGGDLFYFHVVGPDWFAANAPGKGFRWGRGHLVVDHWDADLVRRAIADLCRHVEGGDWGEVARKIARYGQWEFDDYRPARLVT
jgi:hypothetical protein